MENLYNEFKQYMDSQDKENSVRFALELLNENKINLIDFYEKFIKRIMYEIECKELNQSLCVWKEHVRTSIVRTIIENCYLHVIKNTENIIKNKLVAVLCPDGEYHEIGALIASDFFQLCGFESIYVGSSTPNKEFLGVINTLKPDYIAISVTNVYNIFAAQRAIEQIKEKANYDIKIIVGGSAFKHKKEAYKEIGADYLLDSYSDIKKLALEVADK